MARSASASDKSQGFVGAVIAASRLFVGFGAIGVRHAPGGVIFHDAARTIRAPTQLPGAMAMIHHRRGPPRGFTLIEAALVLAIAAVLLGAAVPDLSRTIAARGLAVQAGQFMAT